jgi:acyl carrier protein
MTRLVGYVVLTTAGTAESVRKHAEQHLPACLVPEVLLELRAIPRNERGEPALDALPRPEPQAEPARSPADTASQERVRAVWQKVLELSAIGLEDNFFAIGGHSLTAVRAASELAAEFGVAVTAKLLFDHPTVAATAVALDARAAQDALTTAGQDAATAIRTVRRGRRSLSELLTSAADLTPKE